MCWPDLWPGTALRGLILWLASTCYFDVVVGLLLIIDFVCFCVIRFGYCGVVECDRVSVSMFVGVSGQKCGSGLCKGHFESIMCELLREDVMVQLCL